MAINISVKADMSGFDGFLIGEIKKRIAPKLPIIATASLLEARKQIRYSLELTKEYYSLTQGQLQRDFGLTDPKPIMDNIIEAIQKSVRVSIIPPSTQSFGGIYIGMFKDDFSDALSAYETKYESLNAKGEVHLVEWLKWLLFSGDSVIIGDYGIFSHARDNKARSRTNSGTIMLTLRRNVVPFRVTPNFSGTSTNNWLTRAAEIASIPMQAFLEVQAKFLVS